MSKRKSRRLEPVARVTSHHEQEAMRALGQARQALEEQVRKLGELREYRSDYQQRLQHRGEQGIDIGVLQEYRRFVERLDVAVRQQEEQVVQARQACAVCEAHWQDRRIRSRAMDKAVARSREAEQHIQARREQDETDETAGRISASDATSGDDSR